MHHMTKYLTLMAMLLTLAGPGFCDKAVDYNKRGLAKKYKGDFDGAIADYTVLITLTNSKPDLAAAYNNRSYAKLRKGDFDDGIADFTKAIELKPNEASLHFNRGGAKDVKGDSTEQ